MDRVTRKSILILAFLVCIPVWAGTVFISPEAQKDQDPNERYPVSRFGKPPVDPEMGIDDSYAARETDDMDRANRAPAGLVFGDQADTHAATPRLTAHAETAAKDHEGYSSAELSAMRRKGVQEVAVIANDLGFFPKAIFVSRDVPVRLFVTGASKNTLCIMMDSFQVRRQLRSQRVEEITFTPTTPGKYRFYCPVNGMEGTMIVKELASAGE